MALKRVYWDANCWLGLIKKEPDKIGACNYIIAEATAGRYEIWTSTLTLAEVFKDKSTGAAFSQQQDRDFEDYLALDHVLRVMVDDEVGTTARRLLRQFPALKKPADAIHLATALVNNLDEMHTFDAKNLLPLDGKVERKNGKGYLTIVKPTEPPPNPKISLFETGTFEENPD